MEENNICTANSHQLWVAKLGVRLISLEEEGKTVFTSLKKTTQQHINPISAASDDLSVGKASLKASNFQCNPFQ